MIANDIGGEAEFDAVAVARASIAPGIKIKNTYRFVARDPEGNVKWIEEIDNLTTVEGCTELLQQMFKGSAYTAAWYVGLIDNAGFIALAGADTAAKITTSSPGGGNNGWKETTAYTQANRVTLVLGTPTAGSVDNSASAAVFSINATVSIYGGFVINNSTKGGTTGKLYGEGAFSVVRSLANGDTLTVTVTLTAVTA